MFVLKHLLIYYEKYVGRNCKFPNVCIKQEQVKIFENFSIKNVGMPKLVLPFGLVTFCLMMAVYMSVAH